MKLLWGAALPELVREGGWVRRLCGDRRLDQALPRLRLCEGRALGGADCLEHAALEQLVYRHPDQRPLSANLMRMVERELCSVVEHGVRAVGDRLLAGPTDFTDERGVLAKYRKAQAQYDRKQDRPQGSPSQSDAPASRRPLPTLIHAEAWARLSGERLHQHDPALESAFIRTFGPAYVAWLREAGADAAARLKHFRAHRNDTVHGRGGRASRQAYKDLCVLALGPTTMMQWLRAKGPADGFLSGHLESLAGVSLAPHMPVDAG